MGQTTRNTVRAAHGATGVRGAHPPPRGTFIDRTARAPLRTIFSWITAAVFGVALVVSTALVFLTTFLGWTNESLAAALESVRLAEEIEIELLLHSRSSDLLVRQEIAGELRSKLEDAAAFVQTPREAAALREANIHVNEYLQASRDISDALRPERERRRGAAYAAVHRLADINVHQATEAQAQARELDALADRIGISAAALLLVVAGFLLWWLRTRAFQPLWQITRAMEAFGAGDFEARAEEIGPAELREVALRFNLMASALAAQRRAQMTFLGGVAHDLRNPLCALRMAVSGFARDAPPPDARTRQTLEVFDRQTTYLERMVGDFLDIARIEAGELALRFEELDLRDLAREVAAMFEGWSPRHRITLTLPDAPVPVRCDALRIEQAITNLLSNALKYSPEGGEVEVAVSREPGEGIVSVVDHGVGMRPDDQRKIFEPFIRVGLSRESIPGAGLGLYIVQKIVQSHAGRVEVESELRRGSTFRLRLPLRAKEALPPTSPFR